MEDWEYPGGDTLPHARPQEQTLNLCLHACPACKRGVSVSSVHQVVALVLYYNGMIALYCVIIHTGLVSGPGGDSAGSRTLVKFKFPDGVSRSVSACEATSDTTSTFTTIALKNTQLETVARGCILNQLLIRPPSPLKKLYCMCGYSRSRAFSKHSLMDWGDTKRCRYWAAPALSLVPEARAPPNGCWPTTAPVDLQFSCSPSRAKEVKSANKGREPSQAGDNRYPPLATPTYVEVASSMAQMLLNIEQSSPVARGEGRSSEATSPPSAVVNAANAKPSGLRPHTDLCQIRHQSEHRQMSHQ